MTRLLTSFLHIQGEHAASGIRLSLFSPLGH